MFLAIMLAVGWVFWAIPTNIEMWIEQLTQLVLNVHGGKPQVAQALPEPGKLLVLVREGGAVLPEIKFAVGGVFWALVFAYFAFVGRGTKAVDRTGGGDGR